MPKSTKSSQKPIKRPHTSQFKTLTQQNQKKPRKIIKKDTQVQNLFKKSIKHLPLNFYETIEQVPTYKLSTAQMQGDPIQLLNSLQERYSEFGAIKLVASDSWNCPFTFRYVDKEVTTRIQCLQKLKQGKPFEQKVRTYRIEAYEALANQFKKNYKFKTNPKGHNEQSMIEHQYWNLVTKQQYQKNNVTIEYAADLSTSIYGSGFPTKKLYNWIDSDFQYDTNYFNLNNISKSPSSLLSITEKKNQKISGISYPWLYMGMQFSTFCWHVEDLFVNSLNYNHKGVTKTWYIVPGKYKQKFDNFVQQKFKGSSKKKNVLQKIILMIDPKQLIQAGIKVYKANQRPRQYVCTFFKSYHAGFSHGFNVGQAVNFISAKSLKYIEQSQKYYLNLQQIKQFKPKAYVLSRQWLVYQNINQNKIKNLSKDHQLYVKLQYDKMIQKQNYYLNNELIKKNKLKGINNKKGIIIIPQNVKYQKIYCSYCKNYIYLSSINCKKCGILCQNHIKRCQCQVKQNKFQLIIREPNKDRIRQTFSQYNNIMKVIKEYQKENNKNKNQEKNNKAKQLEKIKNFNKKSNNELNNKRSKTVPVLRKIK